MNLTKEALAELDSHWAVSAIDENTRQLAQLTVNRALVEKALGQQLSLSEQNPSVDRECLERVALAYEMAALEGLPAIVDNSPELDHLRRQLSAGAFRAFDFRRILEVPQEDARRAFHILHLSALAYCGERWPDLKRWYKENADSIRIPETAKMAWDLQLVYTLFDCWVSLFRKNGWDDLNRISVIVADLRDRQKEYEPSLLERGEIHANAGTAIRLIALYHWAKATELLSVYMLQGEPADIGTLLDKHFEAAVGAASASADTQLEVILRWLHAAARIMVDGSLWWVARAVNSRVTRFVTHATSQGLFELLPPQHAALREHGLLDQALTAVVVEMPTSGGKTLLAQFRMLQALNQFDASNGWVAYVAPTRALVAQITRRLRKDFGPIGVRVEQLTGAVEVDSFEQQILSDSGSNSFSILVATPEKLHLVIKNKKVERPLALVVMDEAHNIENVSRGLRIELLLATIKRDCPKASFLLLMPYVEKAETLSRWLAQGREGGRLISFGTTPWRPNERIIGVYRVEVDDSVTSGWRLKFETLSTSEKALHLGGQHSVGPSKPLAVARSKVINVKANTQSGLSLQTAAMAVSMSSRGTSIAVGSKIRDVWSMARAAASSLPLYDRVPDEIALVQRYLQTEVAPEFELASMLARGVGVHHGGLSDEIRSLMEWLAEEGKLKVLCATSTISQGINFPVSSVFLASRSVYINKFSSDMPARDFWNLAGRAGRIDQDSVGVIGLAEGDKKEEIISFVSRATGALASRLVEMLDQLDASGRLHDLERVIYTPEWDDFRCYVAHLWAEKKRLDEVLADTEQLLRNTYGYGLLRSTPEGKQKADALLEVTRLYATKLGDNPGFAKLADSTGFSPEGVGRAIVELGQLQNRLSASDWTPESLFGKSTGMADLFGVMLKVPQIGKPLEELAGKGFDRKHLADITKAWVNGDSLKSIAETYFSSGKKDDVTAFSDACRAIYRTIINNGTWGVAALSKLSGIDFDSLPSEEKRRLDALPAMIYHGVRTEEAVLMRMNSIPRSISEKLGERFSSAQKGSKDMHNARAFLKALPDADWDSVRPKEAALSGADYKEVWGVLSGER